MSNLQPYFSNHDRASKFPWSIYHRPLLNSLENFLKSFNSQESKNILVIGPGELQEISTLLHYGFIPSLLDIDERPLHILKTKYSDKIEAFYHVDENFNGYPTNKKFDAIYAKEVIEHIHDASPFLAHLKNVLKPNGKIWLSTPNYGFFMLPLLENTFLEIVARLSGFSRKGIHPNKFNYTKLKETLLAGGFKDVEVEITPAKLALCATGTLP